MKYILALGLVAKEKVAIKIETYRGYDTFIIPVEGLAEVLAEHCLYN